MCPDLTQNGDNRLARCLQRDTRFRVDFGSQETKKGGTFTPVFETPLCCKA